MCNLYSELKSQEAVRQWARAMRDRTGNLPPLPAIFPNTPAPVVRVDGAERQLEMMRWGMPAPSQFGGRPVTNIRNTKSPHWRRWLGPQSRCLVPATSFCEWTDTKPKTPHWFALADDRPLFAFAGIWTTWHGTFGPASAPIDGEHKLYAFLTTEANDIVAPVHAKAMRVILTTAEECATWLQAPWFEAVRLQRHWQGRYRQDRRQVGGSG